MKDYRKSLLIQWAGFVPVLVSILFGFAFFFQPVYYPHFPPTLMITVIVIAALFMGVPFYHPRVRHYWKAVSEFDKTYSYEK